MLSVTEFMNDSEEEKEYKGVNSKGLKDKGKKKKSKFASKKKQHQ